MNEGYGEHHFPANLSFALKVVKAEAGNQPIPGGKECKPNR